MRPAPFLYVRVGSVAEAVAALAEHGEDARPLAGGQSLIAMMNFRLARPTALVDLSGVAELSRIDLDSEWLRVGAMVTQQDALTSDLVVAHAPLVAQALAHVGHWQIRTRGTVGGNVAHADPASELPAVTLVLGARYRVAGPDGERFVAAADFPTGPYQTVLRPGELLISVDLPLHESSRRFGFHEIARTPGAFALAGAAVSWRDTAGQCRDPLVVLFGTGHAPCRSVAAEVALADRAFVPGVIDASVEAAIADVDPHGDTHLEADDRRQLLGVALRRALLGSPEYAT